MAIKKTKILVITKYIPKPDKNSGDRRFVSLLGILASQFEIDLFIKFKPEPDDPTNSDYISYLENMGIKISSFDEPLWVLLTKKFYKIILFEFYHVALKIIDQVGFIQKHAKIVIDSVDVHFLREESAVHLGLFPLDQAQSNKKIELDIYKKSNAVVVVTEEEKTALEREKIKNIFVIPNIVDLVERESFYRKKELLFIGGFNHKPNIDGVLWFVNKCWDQIIAKHPDAELNIIGSNPTKEIKALSTIKGIKVLGFVKDTAPFLRTAAISVAPLRYGGGMKGKVNEALAYGIPVVTTSYGAQGLPNVNNDTLIVENEPYKMVQRINELLENSELADQIGKNGQRKIASLFTHDQVKNQIFEAFHSLINSDLVILKVIVWKLIAFSYRIYKSFPFLDLLKPNPK